MNKTSKAWIIFVADSKRGFPNFFPVGVYDTRGLAEEELKRLPMEEHYQLFEVPLNTFFGLIRDDKLLSGMGSLYHEHIRVENENVDGE